jgi:hypothetical protein
VVLEHLPEKNDLALAQLKRMRVTLMTNPRNLNLAISVVRRALEAGRRLGDPRFFGQAQAALAPWWSGEDVPPTALLLRATLKQSQHDFEGSLADLDRLLAAEPALAQARLTRATVLSVRGRYADARHDCEQLKGYVAPIVVIGCDATPASLTGNAAGAYGALVQVLARVGVDARRGNCRSPRRLRCSRATFPRRTCPRPARRLSAGGVRRFSAGSRSSARVAAAFA